MSPKSPPLQKIIIRCTRTLGNDLITIIGKVFSIPDAQDYKTGARDYSEKVSDLVRSNQMWTHLYTVKISMVSLLPHNCGTQMLKLILSPNQKVSLGACQY